MRLNTWKKIWKGAKAHKCYVCGNIIPKGACSFIFSCYIVSSRIPLHQIRVCAACSSVPVTSRYKRGRAEIYASDEGRGQEAE